MEQGIDSRAAVPASSPLDANTSTTQPNFFALFAERRLLLLGGDVLTVLLMVQAALVVWHQFDQNRFVQSRAPFWLWFPIFLAMWLGLAWLNDLYDVPSSTNRLQSVGRVLIASALALVIYMLVFFVAPRELLPRVFFVAFLVLNTAAMLLWRYGYAMWMGNRPMQYRVLIIGDGFLAQTIAHILRQSPHVQYDVLGHISTGAASITRERAVGEPLLHAHGASGNDAAIAESLPTLGTQDDLGYLVNQLHVHELVVAVKNPLDHQVFQSLIECQAWGVKVSSMADLYEKLTYRIPVEYIDPAWALQVIQDRPVFDRVQLALKRTLDILLASMGLLMLVLVLPFVVLAIKLTSPGPVLYRQTRCGQAGKPFKILKFRTMTSDAEQDGTARWATRGDQRITSVGRFLRKTRIDELPQLINVLRGDMGFVGPRPERPEFVATLQHDVPFYYTRLMMKPGITGWAQIHYDYGNTVEDALIKLQYDFYYLRYWSIWLDLYTIFQTFKVVFQFKGI